MMFNYLKLRIMKTGRINNYDISLGSPNQFVIARVSKSFQDKESFFMVAQDIMSVEEKKNNIIYDDVKLIVISKNNKIIVHARDIYHYKKFVGNSKVSIITPFDMFIDDGYSELLIENIIKGETEIIHI